MKLLKYISFFILTSVMFYSCGEDESMTKKLENGINVFTFTETIVGYSAIADGAEYTIDLNAKITGPNMQNVSGAISAKMVVDTEASTAIEGTHYRIDNPNLTLSKDGDYLGIANITMLTNGIQTPLAASPKLVVRFEDVSGSTTVAGSQKSLVLTLNYACPSFLAGDYTVVVLRDGAVITPYSDVTITNTGIGEYRTSEVGHWAQASLGYTPGFTFTDVCNVLNVPSQNLVDAYGNIVQGTKPGSADPVTGILEIEYSISSSGWSSVYTCTYTPK